MAIGATSAFRPTGTVSLNAGITSANLPLAGGGETVVVTNATAYLAYVRFGSDATVVASAGDMPILPNSRAILSVNSLISYAAALITGGSGNVLFTRGDGSFL
jgi:hypothetical protein